MENSEMVTKIKGHVANYFTIKEYYTSKNTLNFVIYDYDKYLFEKLVSDLDSEGYVPFLKEKDNSFEITIFEKKKHGKSNINFNIALFIVTIITTIFAGYIFSGGKIIDGVAFSIAIMSIIGGHETAHYLAAKKHGVKATLPYFIPAPTLIGTFGAVINVKSPIPNKNALFDLGVSGPLVGIIITIPILIIGIYLSNLAPMQKETIVFMPSLLMALIANLIFPQVPEGYMINIHPIAFAGWVGIIITMLNLMPVAFLDGGHISRSIFSEKIHRYISYLGIVVTFLLGWIPMGILMIVILFWSKKHPGALDHVTKLTRGRKILAVITLLVFIMCLSPIPLTSL
ncbi:MAG: site-2 protease family protein [Methanomicrobiales archaeon]